MTEIGTLYILRNLGKRWVLSSTDGIHNVGVFLPSDFVQDWLRYPKNTQTVFLDKIQVSQIMALYKSYKEVRE